MSTGKKYDNFTFTEDQLRYDPDEWLVPAQDSKGHSVPSTLRIPTGLANEIQIILQHKRFPYHTPADLMRHAVLRHIRWLQELEPRIPLHFLGALQMLQDMVTTDLYRVETEKTLQSLEGAVQRLLNSGDVNEAILLVAKSRVHLEKVPDSPSRKRALDMFSERFAGLLEEGERGWKARVPKQIAGPAAAGKEQAGGVEPEVLDAVIVEEDEDVVRLVGELMEGKNK